MPYDGAADYLLGEESFPSSVRSESSVVFILSAHAAAPAHNVRLPRVNPAHTRAAPLICYAWCMSVQIKRAYESPSKLDGMRVLVDRIWPRGLSKDRAAIDMWAKDLAPSSDLRQWFGHDPAKWNEFKRRYFAELRSHDGVLKDLKNQSRKKKVTLVYGARDTAHNNAEALKMFLAGRH